MRQKGHVTLCPYKPNDSWGRVGSPEKWFWKIGYSHIVDGNWISLNSKHSTQVPLSTGNKRKQSNVSPSNWAASLQRATPPIKTKERRRINTHPQKDFLPCKQRQSIQIDFWRILDSQASPWWSNAQIDKPLDMIIKIFRNYHPIY